MKLKRKPVLLAAGAAAAAPPWPRRVSGAAGRHPKTFTKSGIGRFRPPAFASALSRNRQLR